MPSRDDAPKVNQLHGTRHAAASGPFTRRLVAIRAEAVWRCLSILDPDLKGEAKLDLARKVMTLVDGKDRSQPRPLPLRITSAEVEAVIWGNVQCIHPQCPMLLFSRQIADEINEFFAP